MPPLRGVEVLNDFDAFGNPVNKLSPESFMAQQMRTVEQLNMGISERRARLHTVEPSLNAAWEYRQTLERRYDPSERTFGWTDLDVISSVYASPTAWTEYFLEEAAKVNSADEMVVFGWESTGSLVALLMYQSNPGIHPVSFWISPQGDVLDYGDPGRKEYPDSIVIVCGYVDDKTARELIDFVSGSFEGAVVAGFIPAVYHAPDGSDRIMPGLIEVNGD